LAVDPLRVLAGYEVSALDPLPCLPGTPEPSPAC